MTVGEHTFMLTAAGAVRAGARILPLVSDHALLTFARMKIADVPWPEGRAFMERLLGELKHDLDADASAYAELPGIEWYGEREEQRHRKASGQ